ncbi:phage tail protein [uncultured Tateyamaria sp.]|uniref:phage tail-collar fiber domain-containing protein n=1 Tax=uncultured Tateyamaria sp. TaxID=455651 RepID=UPI0026332244|nr:phage tail protein [uncultured Tateyamaria sp.]
MPETLITDTGERLLALATGSGAQVEITHIAIGDANGLAYDPSYDQTALVNEIARAPIELQSQVDANSWRVKVSFPATMQQAYVREIGAYDVDGNLVTIWAGLDVEPRQVGVVDYLIDHVLGFSRTAEGLLIVSAPDDETENFRMATTRMLAELAHQQFLQSEAIRAGLSAF